MLESTLQQMFADRKQEFNTPAQIKAEIADELAEVMKERVIVSHNPRYRAIPDEIWSPFSIRNLDVNCCYILQTELPNGRRITHQTPNGNLQWTYHELLENLVSNTSHAGWIIHKVQPNFGRLCESLLPKMNEMIASNWQLDS